MDHAAAFDALPLDAQRKLRRARHLHYRSKHLRLGSNGRNKFDMQSKLLTQEALDLSLDAGVTVDQFKEAAFSLEQPRS